MLMHQQVRAYLLFPCVGSATYCTLIASVTYHIPRYGFGYPDYLPSTTVSQNSEFSPKTLQMGSAFESSLHILNLDFKFKTGAPHCMCGTDLGASSIRARSGNLGY